jgi:hypothetical protein
MQNEKAAPGEPGTALRFERRLLRLGYSSPSAGQSRM